MPSPRSPTGRDDASHDPTDPIGAALCPGCSGRTGGPVFTVAATPVTCASVFASAPQARAVPLGRVELVSCTRCGLAFNPCFDAVLAEVGARYESSQAASAHFSQYARGLARDWVDRYRLRGRSVLEIGCGRGEFLRLMLGQGVARAHGLDPVAPAEGVHEEGLTIEPRRFDRDTLRLRADAIVCRHTLEHIAEIHSFLALLAHWARTDPQRVVLFEVPATERVLSEAAFWDIYYEHCSYFTSASLVHAFRRAGFEVLRVERVYGDQYLILEARAGDAAAANPCAEFSALHQDYVDFGRAADRAIAHCDAGLAALAASGRPVVLWQGASKTVGFLSALRRVDLIDCAVDLSPQRHGQYLPGSGLAVHAPEALPAIDPAFVVLMNPVYLAEVGARLAALRVNATLLTVNELCTGAARPGRLAG